MSPQRLDHLGIAVYDLETALARYRDGLGLVAEGVEDVPTEQVRVAFLALGDTHLELLESTHPDSPIARALAKRGEGIHHLAIEVDDIRAAMAQAQATGMELLSAEPRPGAGGRLVAFVHPRTTGGVLIELVQKPGR